MACTHSNDKRGKKDMNSPLKSVIHYARGFTIQRFRDYTQIVVRNPWDSTQLMEKYILVNRNKKLPANLPQGTIVKVPVERAAVCSAVHAGMWHQLGKIDKVIAVCEPEYINLPEIKDGLIKGRVTDLGMATAINFEKLLAVTPEVLIVSPFENAAYERFKNQGIVVLIDASYMEDSPLGRSEWIKFEAAFAGEDSLAAEIFSGIEQRYLKLCSQVSKIKSRPTVFTEKKYGDSWYVSGGNSYTGNFLRDAGAAYLWSDLKNPGSVPFTFEKVFAKAINADFWLIKYNDSQNELTYQRLGDEYELYKNFKAYKDKNIFTLNSGRTPYYEVGPMEPDVVLADLVSIFHPELLPGYKPKYYFRMK
jgi:iron complex transport system substrate-binding protein